VKTQDLEYRDEAGGRYVGYLASPEHPTGPAILIGHGAPGIDAHERDVAQRLAELGYVALAADYLGAENTVSQEAKGARLQALFADSTGLRAPMQTALAALKAIAGVAADRVAVIGYCFGGTAALELGCAHWPALRSAAEPPSRLSQHQMPRAVAPRRARSDRAA